MVWGGLTSEGACQAFPSFKAFRGPFLASWVARQSWSCQAGWRHPARYPSAAPWLRYPKTTLIVCKWIQYMDFQDWIDSPPLHSCTLRRSCHPSPSSTPSALIDWPHNCSDWIYRMGLTGSLSKTFFKNSCFSLSSLIWYLMISLVDDICTCFCLGNLSLNTSQYYSYLIFWRALACNMNTCYPSPRSMSSISDCSRTG